ncbi:IRE protein kinase [Trichuris trichiura]|uniref:non-specific serine/threonine protein kinase n=1 Tax=Trichuris trichiura TaxID=36087 RepID=A0A077YY06_TRITR|nr:IRE protein kinase [Trichuris trichiura]
MLLLLQELDVAARLFSIYRNSVFVSTIDGTLYVLDSVSGDVQTIIRQPPILKTSMVHQNAMVFLPDPQDGSLYQLFQGRLQKLPLTIPALVHASPCKSSDGLLFAGSKHDSWLVFVPGVDQGYTIQQLDEQDGMVCPTIDNTELFIGRSEYKLRIMDINDGRRRWNLTYVQYASKNAPAQSDYAFEHYSSCSDGLLVTVDSATGRIMWKRNFKSIVIGMYQLHSDGLRRLQLHVLGSDTLQRLIADQLFSSAVRDPFLSPVEPLRPAMFVGKHSSSLYALNPLVDRKTVVFSPRNRALPLLEGPTAVQVPTHSSDDAQVGLHVAVESWQHLLEDNSTDSIDPPVFYGYYKLPPLTESKFFLLTSKLPSLLPQLSYIAHEVNSDEPASSVSAKRWLKDRVEALLLAALIWVFVAKFNSACRFVKFLIRFGLRRAVTSSLDRDEGTTVGRIWFDAGQVLGHGCNGTIVYKGVFDGRDVAVKRIFREYSAKAQREVKLLRESDSHRNVVRYFCMETDKLYCYIALQLCQCTLQHYVEDADLRGQISVKPKMLLEQTTLGLAHLHKLKIGEFCLCTLFFLLEINMIILPSDSKMHRDLKPQNVLLYCSSSDGQPVAMISDFDLGQQLYSRNWNGRFSTAGTEGWMAPEVIKGESVCCLSDIFSLGCLYHYVLTTGEHPFGEAALRQSNILVGNFTLQEQLIQQEGRDLIGDMIHSDSLLRPTAVQAIHHPFFWSKQKQLSFLQDISDRVEKVDSNDEIVQRLEMNGRNVVGGNWQNRICEALQDDLRRFRSYRGRSIRDLLRALRNKRHHYHELSPEVRNALGSIPDQFVDYFTGRFPLLLMHVYKAGQLLRNEDIFASYYYALS